MLKKGSEYIYLLYCVHIGILLPNIVWWLWSNVGVLVLVLIFAMVDNEESINKNKRVNLITNNIETEKVINMQSNKNNIERNML